jgi:preprotein translocase subunit YajC
MRQYQTLIMIALMVVAFYFLIMRPQRKRQQAIQRTMSELTPGTRVLLNSGIFGTVLAVGDRQALIELAPGVELTVLKQAIARIATEADEDTFVDEDDDDGLKEAFDEPDAVQPEAVEPIEPDRPEPGSKPSSSFARPDVEPGPEQQRPSSN